MFEFHSEDLDRERNGIREIDHVMISICGLFHISFAKSVFFSFSSFRLSLKTRMTFEWRFSSQSYIVAAVRCSVSVSQLDFMYVTKIVEPYVAYDSLVMRSHKRDFFLWFFLLLQFFHLISAAEIGWSKFTKYMHNIFSDDRNWKWWYDWISQESQTLTNWLFAVHEKTCFYKA